MTSYLSGHLYFFASETSVRQIMLCSHTSLYDHNLYLTICFTSNLSMWGFTFFILPSRVFPQSIFIHHHIILHSLYYCYLYLLLFDSFSREPVVPGVSLVLFFLFNIDNCCLYPRPVKDAGFTFFSRFHNT